MKELTHTRTGKNIGYVGKNMTDTCESINKAKKMSRKLQMANDGGLGRGSLRKVTRKSKDRTGSFDKGESHA
jgi:hypothetical protein